MRQRLSWDKDKVAAIMKKADPYTLNQDHQNNPIQKYQTGDTSSWAEDPDMAKRWEGEGRNEVGLPAPSNAAPAAPAAPAAAPADAPAPAGMPPAQQAVMAARKLEDKALKCITIAGRMLPGGADDLIEAQATDLMYMPERCILATLQRQAELADKLAEDEEAEGKVEGDKEEGKEDKADKAAQDDKKDGKEPPVVEPPAQAGTEEQTKDADDASALPPAPPAGAAPAAPAPAAPAKDDKDDKGDKGDKEEGKEDKDDKGDKTAKEQDLLDIIFANEEPKAGVKKLSGIVKQASVGGTDLTDLWAAPPDVSSVFK